MTTPPPIDPFTAELLTRLAQGAFHPPAPMSPPGLMQPPAEPPAGLGQIAGLVTRVGIEAGRKKDPAPAPSPKPRRFASDFLVGAPDGISPELWQLLTGGS